MENVKKNISADMSGNILDIKDLAVSFDVYGLRSYVLDGINFTVKKGQRVGLVGESGCGKTNAGMDRNISVIRMSTVSIMRPLL